jgi:type IV secretion system protein VirD4
MSTQFLKIRILTQTERLMMNNRPKDPKRRGIKRLIIGGSGSARQDSAEAKPYAMPQLIRHNRSESSILIECGKLLQRNNYKIKISIRLTSKNL